MAKLKPGTLAGKIYDLDQEIKQVRVDLEKTKEAKKLAKLGEKRIKLAEDCIKVLEENELESASGGSGKIAIKTSIKIVIDPAKGGWEKLYGYIHKNKAFHILNKAIKQDSIKEELANGEKIPGIGKFHAKSLSVTKNPSKK